MSKIRLIFQQASEVVGNVNEGLLVLTDSYQERQIVITCGEPLLSEFKSRVVKRNTNSGLADILMNIIMHQTNLSLAIEITDVVKGSYDAVLTNEDTLAQIRIGGVEAVLLNKMSKDKIPLYIDEKLFLQQSSVYNMKAQGVSLPINALSVPMLQKTLDKAVSLENYELASQLRDEPKKRLQSSSTISVNDNELGDKQQKS